jgi:hypothetical protein
VLAGLSAAAAAGLAPVKVNAVLMRGVNDHEAPGLLRFCLDRGYQLRFIEQMPLDAQHGWRRAEMVTGDEILARLSDRFSLTPDDPGSRGSAPAETFMVDGSPGHGISDPGVPAARPAHVRHRRLTARRHGRLGVQDIQEPYRGRHLLAPPRDQDALYPLRRAQLLIQLALAITASWSRCARTRPPASARSSRASFTMSSDRTSRPCRAGLRAGNLSVLTPEADPSTSSATSPYPRGPLGVQAFCE